MVELSLAATISKTTREAHAAKEDVHGDPSGVMYAFTLMRAQIGVGQKNVARSSP